MISHLEAKTVGEVSPKQISGSGPPHFLRWLWALWLATSVGRFLASLILHGPVIFADEISYWEMARSFHRFGNFEMYFMRGHLPTVLYSVAISPAFVWNPPKTEYLVVKLTSSLLMASAVFPAYGLAREFLDHKWALIVALMTALAPGGMYSGLVMAENLFFPMFVLTVWFCFRTLDTGRWLDAVAAGLLLAIGFHVKIQAMFLAVAYPLPLLVWAGGCLLGKQRPTWGSWLRGAIVRALPVLIFAAMIGLRVAAGHARQQGFTASIFGDLYTGLAGVSGHIVPRRFLATLLAMGEGLAISTLFLPAAALLVSVGILHKQSFRLILFWSLTVSCTAVYFVMVARHNALYDDMLRVHERYFFVVTPMLWVWFLAIRERLRPAILWLATAGLIALCAWSIEQSLPNNLMSWDSPTDSPTLTLFFYLRLPPNFMPFTAVSGLMALSLLASLALYGASRRQAFTAAVPWALALLLLDSGWYVFEHNIVAPTQVRPTQAILKLGRSFSSHDRIALLYDTNFPLNDFMFCYFWWENPITQYSPEPSSVWTGQQLPTRNGKPDFSQLSEEYVAVIGEPQLDLPVVDATRIPKITLYRNSHQPALQ